jgi:hypothetical protein
MPIMLKEMTRSRLVQVWFAAAAFMATAAVVMGAAVSAGTGVLLLILCLAPPSMLLMLWPAAEPQTIAEVLYDADRKTTSRKVDR